MVDRVEKCYDRRSTWEKAESIMQKFLQFDPWGQGSLDGGSIDTITSMGSQLKTGGDAR